MKSSFYKLMLIIVLALSLVVSVYALDDQGNVNDPTENSSANACYEGGSMEGKCDTPEEWEAGWYVIRFEYGLISREDFPAYFNWALPDEFVEGSSVNGLCFTNGTKSLLYSGISAVAGNFQMYNSTDCTGSTLPSSALSTEKPIIIVASSSSSAGATCNSIQASPIGIDSLGAYGYASPSNYYVCVGN